MLSRILVGILGIIVLLSIFLKGGILLLVFSEVVILLSCIELFSMIRKKGNYIYLYRGLFIAGIIPFLVFFNIDMNIILIISFLFLAISEIFLRKIKRSTKNASITFFITIYISYMFSYIIKIGKLDNSSAIIIFTFFIVWAADTFAYMFGIAFGRHKFSNISPNKSIEGIIGGFLGVLIISRYFGYIYYFITSVFSNIKIFKIYPEFVSFFDKYSFKLILFSIIILILSILGDLFESKIKREFEVKDSSNLLLGHGGFLDRFDSSLFVIPAMFILINYIK